MKTTSQNFADTFGIPYASANGLLRALVDLELATTDGVEKEAGKRGKGKTIYVVKADAAAKLGKLLTSKLAA